MGSEREIKLVTDNPRLKSNPASIRIDLKDTIQMARHVHDNARAHHLPG
jgi:hypothetical protein